MDCWRKKLSLVRFWCLMTFQPLILSYSIEHDANDPSIPSLPLTYIPLQKKYPSWQCHHCILLLLLLATTTIMNELHSQILRLLSDLTNLCDNCTKCCHANKVGVSSNGDVEYSSCIRSIPFLPRRYCQSILEQEILRLSEDN